MYSSVSETRIEMWQRFAKQEWQKITIWWVIIMGYFSESTTHWHLHRLIFFIVFIVEALLAVQILCHNRASTKSHRIKFCNLTSLQILHSYRSAIKKDTFIASHVLKQGARKLCEACNSFLPSKEKSDRIFFIESVCHNTGWDVVYSVKHPRLFFHYLVNLVSTIIRPDSGELFFCSYLTPYTTSKVKTKHLIFFVRTWDERCTECLKLIKLTWTSQ